jgi:phage terminase large subunit-like protein
VGVIKVIDSVWTDVYVDEMVTFPNGVHDDQVDATAGAWGMMDSKVGTLSVGVKIVF